MSNLQTGIASLAARSELDVEAEQLPTAALHLTDADLVAALREVAQILNDAGRIQAVLAGVVSHRSPREAGQSGLSAAQGHASPAALVQSIAGGTSTDARRHLRVGASLLEGAGVVPGARHAGEDPALGRFGPWHEALGVALLQGRVTPAQHDAIRQGLGEPRVGGEHDHTAHAVREAWALAADGLVDVAAQLSVEDLSRQARTVRDMLDPVGAEERFARRFDDRGFRLWQDAGGQYRARISFDDEMALWVRSILDAALRPRRGGPRFVTDASVSTQRRCLRIPAATSSSSTTCSPTFFAPGRSPSAPMSSALANPGFGWSS